MLVLLFGTLTNLIGQSLPFLTLCFCLLGFKYKRSHTVLAKQERYLNHGKIILIVQLICRGWGNCTTAAVFLSDQTKHLRGL